MQDIDSEIQNALQSAGLRLSGLRREILKMLNAPNSIFNQRYIMESLKEQRVSKAAAINAIHELTAAGVIRKLVVGKEIYYDGWQEPHHTIVCRGCNKFEQVPLRVMDIDIHHPLEHNSSMRISKQGGFFSGVCRACATLNIPKS